MDDVPRSLAERIAEIEWVTDKLADLINRNDVDELRFAVNHFQRFPHLQDLEIMRVASAILYYNNDLTAQLCGVLRSRHFGNRWQPLLQRLWFDMHYRIEETNLGRRIGTTEKFRIRKKFPLPPTLYNSESISNLNMENRTRRILAHFFEICNCPTYVQKCELALITGLTKKELTAWFRRQRGYQQVMQRRAAGVILEGLRNETSFVQTNTQVSPMSLIQDNIDSPPLQTENMTTQQLRLQEESETDHEIVPWYTFRQQNEVSLVNAVPSYPQPRPLSFPMERCIEQGPITTENSCSPQQRFEDLPRNFQHPRGPPQNFREQNHFMPFGFQPTLGTRFPFSPQMNIEQGPVFDDDRRHEELTRNYNLSSVYGVPPYPGTRTPPIGYIPGTSMPYQRQLVQQNEVMRNVQYTNVRETANNTPSGREFVSYSGQNSPSNRNSERMDTGDGMIASTSRQTTSSGTVPRRSLPFIQLSPSSESSD